MFSHPLRVEAEISPLNLEAEFRPTASKNDNDRDRFLTQMAFNGRDRHTKEKDRERQQIPEQSHQ